MKFIGTALAGVIVVEPDKKIDDRGSFSRVYCPSEFAAAGINFAPTQVNLSFNISNKTLRGLHYQDPPNAEAKIVRVVHGHAWDVVVDMRPDSRTRGQWTATDLTGSNQRSIFIPEGCAHGFLTLAAETSLLYQMGRPYELGLARGLRWDDPLLAISWPHAPIVISDQDCAWPDYFGW